MKRKPISFPILHLMKVVDLTGRIWVVFKNQDIGETWLSAEDSEIMPNCIKFPIDNFYANYRPWDIIVKKRKKRRIYWFAKKGYFNPSGRPWIEKIEPSDIQEMKDSITANTYERNE